MYFLYDIMFNMLSYMISGLMCCLKLYQVYYVVLHDIRFKMLTYIILGLICCLILFQV